MAEELLIRGDMFGDKILVGESHRTRADALWQELGTTLLSTPKIVVAIAGPSGSGKSEIASLIGTQIIKEGGSAYVLSCDNYPWKPPRQNDATRVAIFEDKQKEGLSNYLGTRNEIDFDRIESLVKGFQNQSQSLNLRIIDTTNHCIHQDPMPLDVSNIQVLLLEGTWSNLIDATNIKIFLETDFEATLEHRKNRARDPITPFGELVLELEQSKLDKIKQERSHLVVNLDGGVKPNIPCELLV